MKKEDFKIPYELEKKRKVVLKGKVYASNGTLVMAQETTCSLTKKTFKGVCVGINEDFLSNEITIVGSVSEWNLENFASEWNL